MADEKPERVLLHPAGVGRRHILQGLFAGVGAGAILPPSLSAETHHMAPAVATAQAKAKATNWKAEFLDAHQFATLTVLCARILPGSDTAHADRFIDSILAQDTPDHTRRFLSALGAFEGQALSRFQKPFRELTEAQQVEILTAASTGEPGRKDESWTPGTLLPDPESGPDEATVRDVRLRAMTSLRVKPERVRESVTLRDQFDVIKSWIVDAYYSSEAGLKELGYTGQAFFPEFPDCKHPEHQG